MSYTKRFLRLTSLLNTLDVIRTNFWFVPGTMVLGSFFLAWFAVWLDILFGEAVQDRLPTLFVSKPESAQLILSTLAGSMITLTGVVFSITIVALTLASSQFGPRLLREFMRDGFTQAVLGTFVSTFVYCVTVLFTIKSGEDSPYVPDIAVSLSLVFGLTSVGILVFFIHHVSDRIHVSSVVDSVAEDWVHQVELAYPEEVSKEGGWQEEKTAEEIRKQAEEQPIQSVPATEDGYVRVVDEGALIDLATERGWLIDLKILAGDFLIRGVSLMEVYGPEEIEEEDVRTLQAQVKTGIHRTSVQDIRFPIDQLVEVALRALSPGINDPQTAVSCAHRLGQGVGRLSKRSLPAEVLYDKQGHARLLCRRMKFPDIVDSCFARIHAAANGNPRVLAAIGEVLDQVGTITEEESRKQVLEEARERFG
jgi:uncharacterized membrane protein